MAVYWQPDPRARGSVAELATRVLEEPQDVFGNPRRPAFGIAWDEAEHSMRAPSVTPFPDRLAIQAEPPTGRQHPVFDGVRDDGHALLDPEPIAWSDPVLSFGRHGTSSFFPAILRQRSH